MKRIKIFFYKTIAELMHVMPKRIQKNRDLNYMIKAIEVAIKN